MKWIKIIDEENKKIIAYEYKYDNRILILIFYETLTCEKIQYYRIEILGAIHEYCETLKEAKKYVEYYLKRIKMEDKK